MAPCPRGGMVDIGDLKSLGRKAVPVRVRPRAPLTINLYESTHYIHSGPTCRGSIGE